MKAEDRRKLIKRVQTLDGESTEKVKPTFRLKVNNGEIAVLPFFFCLS